MLLLHVRVERKGVGQAVCRQYFLSSFAMKVTGLGTFDLLYYYY